MERQRMIEKRGLLCSKSRFSEQAENMVQKKSTVIFLTFADLLKNAVLGASLDVFCGTPMLSPAFQKNPGNSRNSVAP